MTIEELKARSQDHRRELEQIKRDNRTLRIVGAIVMAINAVLTIVFVIVVWYHIFGEPK